MKEVIWKPIKTYEGYYEVSNTGLVKSLKRDIGMGSRRENRLLTVYDKRGYSQVALSKDGNTKYLIVHRLVAEAFIPNPNNYPQVNHIDGDKNNNLVSNLEWCDQSQNMVHARKNKLMGGEKTNTAKLTERDIVAIRYLYPKVNKRELSKAFNIGESTIGKIIKKEYWKYA